MKEIYCISTGEYSDWRIVYAFENKEKRDLLLTTLGEDYNSYDIELDDYRINIEDIKDIFTMNMTKNYVSLTKGDPIDLSNHRSVFIDRGELYSLTFIITKEQYDVLSRKLPKFNPNLLRQYETFEDEFDILDADCESGACPVR